MSRRITARRVSGQQARFLAVLIDADGAVVSYAVLGDAVGACGVNDRAVLKQYGQRLQERGVGGVEHVRGRGYRMTRIPPDWALDDVLAVLDQMRRAGELPAARWRRAS